MRSRELIFGLLLLAAPAHAQDKIVPVVFSFPGEDWRTKPLADAIRSALSRTPGFNLMAKASPDALIILLPGLQVDGHEQNAVYNFTIMFGRGGSKIGESAEECKASALSECATQIASDAQSAAGMMK